MDIDMDVDIDLKKMDKSDIMKILVLNQYRFNQLIKISHKLKLKLEKQSEELRKKDEELKEKDDKLEELLSIYQMKEYKKMSSRELRGDVTPPPFIKKISSYQQEVTQMYNQRIKDINDKKLDVDGKVKPMFFYPKTELCKDYMDGKCKNDEISCKYAHGNEHLHCTKCSNMFNTIVCGHIAESCLNL